ncbi:hypothetical protein ACIA98_39370 [Streptomyces sp. NPDC051366]|uniref:hypothetical protein n=1 Tax=Streptomyces sp. NPDC051366 TaxID=3365652 RepID=UPI00378A93F1
MTPHPQAVDGATRYHQAATAPNRMRSVGRLGRALRKGLVVVDRVLQALGRA